MPILVPPLTPGTGPGVPGAMVHSGTVSLGEVVFGGTDESGVEWILEELKGWSDAAPSTGQTEQRVSDHGGINNRAFYASRLIEITGTLLASDWGAASLALDRLMAAIPLDDPDWLYVDDGYRSLQAKVRQDGDPIVDRLANWARFSIALVAADPRRYGYDEVSASTGLPITTGGLSLGGVGLTLPLSVGATTVSGTVVVTNEGNMPTRPTMTVTGPCPAFTITHLNSGRRLSVFEETPAGRTLTLDADRRVALLDGTALRVVTGTWFDLEPGVNEVAFNAAAYEADATLTVTFRSAWR